MSGHTPGPWRVQGPAKGRSVNTEIYADNWQPIASLRPRHQASALPEHAEINARIDADARLIAAAPDLYNAVVAMKERVPLRGDPQEQHTCGDCRMCHAIAEQVLSKAEGLEP